jgi:RNA polymerase sigma-70 factor (ECF subfamily)
MMTRTRDAGVEGIAGCDHLSPLMAAAAADRPGAFDALVRAALPLIRAAVRRRMGSGHAEAEDAVQDTLIALHRVRGEYDPRRPAGPWIARIAEQRALDRLRGLWRWTRKASEFAGEYETGCVEPRSTLSGVELAEKAQRLRTAIAGLPPSQRTALRLAKLEELPLAEASRRSGMSVAALKIATMRGVRALRRALGEPAGAV